MYAPGYPDITSWLAGARDETEAPATGALLDKRSRRRASPLTKALADAYGQALSQSGADASTVASVFGSALGEASTMIALLEQMWRGGTALSPMRFATSVHNAAAGVVSIATGNKGFTTSLGADYDTAAMALLEGVALVRTHGTPVLVACGDEASPERLVTEGQGWGTLAVAVALLPAEQAPPSQPRLSLPARGTPDLAPPDVPPWLQQNPVVGLLDLASSVARGHVGHLRLDRGRGLGYCVHIANGR